MSYDQTYSQSYYGFDAPGFGSDVVEPATNPVHVPIVVYFPENSGRHRRLALRPGVTEKDSRDFVRYVQDQTDSSQWSLARALVTYVQSHAETAWAASRRNSRRNLVGRLEAVDKAIRHQIEGNEIFKNANALTLGFESVSAFQSQFTEHVGTPPAPMDTLLYPPRNPAASSAYGRSNNQSHGTQFLATGQTSTSAYGIGQMSIPPSDYPTGLSYRRNLLEYGLIPSETSLPPGQHLLRHLDNDISQSGPSSYTLAFAALPRSSALPEGSSTLVASPDPDIFIPDGSGELQGKRSSTAEVEEEGND